jgi:thiol-disulfide isomerase/thioredoxin
MSSRNHSDSYAKFGGYNGQNGKPSNSSYKTYNQLDQKDQKQVETPQQNINISTERFSNVPPPKQNLENLGQLRNTISNPQQPSNAKVIQNVQKSHRVRDIDGPKLLNLLQNPEYHFAKNGQPLKIILKVYTDWCGPCKIIKPKFEELSTNSKYADILFLQVDGEKMGAELTNVLKVGGVPVFFGFVSGKKVKVGGGADFVAGADINAVAELCNRMSEL